MTPTRPVEVGTLDASREYLRRGWAVVPIPRGQKAPLIPGWPELRLTESGLAAHFDNGSNIGAILGSPSGGLVDVDLDCVEAIAVADLFLPQTECVFGRTSKPRSHRFYFCESENPLARPRPTKFCAPDGTALVELRADGQQTVLPPSLHLCGENYEFDCGGEPAHIAGNDLLRAVSRIAAAALIARHWPAQGQRHDAAIALAGMLLRARWPEQEVENFIRAVATATGDEELRDRIRAVVSTETRLFAGKTATGAPTLASIIGDSPVYRVRDWVGISEHIASSLPFTDSSAPWPEPLAPEAFHGLAGEIVRAIEPCSEADPAALLIQLLTAFGNVVGCGSFYIVEGHRHFTNIFALIVGATAKGRKGVSWQRIAEIFSRIDNAWVLARIHGGVGSGEGIIWQVRDAILKGEKLLDAGIDDKRLLLLESEFAQVLAVCKREGGTLSEVLRRAWDGTPLQTLTKNSPARATGAHISLVGHITKVELLRHLDETEIANGLMNRVIFCCARRSKALPDGGSLDEACIAPLIERLKAAVAFASEPHELRRDENARSLWHEVYSELSEGRAGLFGALVSRSEAQVLRLSMIFALLDCSPVIQRAHLLAALAVWQFADASAAHVFGDSLGDPVADEILRALRATPEGLTRNEIRDLFQRHKTSDEVNRAVGVLLSFGVIEVCRETTAGRPAQRLMARQLGRAVSAKSAER